MSEKIFYTLSVLTLTLACLLAFNNNVKKYIFSKSVNKTSKVLTTLSADLNNTGSTLKVVKLKNSDGIYLDLFQYDQIKRQHKKIDTIKLKHKQDGFYKFGKEATNLFTTDLNNDGQLEIIAPTHSPQLKPYLNIVNFNPKSQRLEFSSQSLFSF